MNTAACIDIGTNSVLLSIGKPSREGWIEETGSAEKVTQLGKGLDASNELQPDAMERTRQAVLEMVGQAREYGAEAIYLIGTQALRKAANAKAFIDQVRDNIGITIQVISGEREAQLSFLAVDKSLQRIQQKTVIDIGGGSTEIAQDVHGKTVIRKSISVGCVSLTDRFSYPAEIPEMQKWLKVLCKEEFGTWITKPSDLVGLGGTITSLAGVHLGLKKYDPKLVHGHVLPLEWIDSFSRAFSSMTSREKESLPCMPAARVGVLGGGIEILLAIMSTLQKNHVVVSDAGLRHAVLWEHFELGRLQGRQKKSEVRGRKSEDGGRKPD